MCASDAARVDRQGGERRSAIPVDLDKLGDAQCACEFQSGNRNVDR
jgi:hypothetical protein